MSREAAQMARSRAAPLLVLLAAAALIATGASARPHHGRPMPARFAHEGGPPFMDVGLVYLHNMSTGYGSEDGAVGYFLNGTYTFTYLVEGGVRVERGSYLSWECASQAPVNGTYRALVEVTTVEADGTETEPRIMCQTGIVDLNVDSGPWLDWSQSDKECLHYTSISFDLFSYDRLGQLQNVCGDPTPETPPVPSEQEHRQQPDNATMSSQEGDAPAPAPAPDPGPRKPWTPGREGV